MYRHQKCISLAKGPGVLILDLEKFCPVGCVSFGVARSGLTYSPNKREASDSNWSIGWDKHANCKQTQKREYIYYDTINIDIDIYDVHPGKQSIKF